mmetsp:Transcript_9748/g.22221  ORF Transcript_9748/g.22221 Transcript_9748/m.22221 type:complete len:224 (+) Transcript_9748:173-844(+)
MQSHHLISPQRLCRSSFMAPGWARLALRWRRRRLLHFAAIACEIKHCLPEDLCSLCGHGLHSAILRATRGQTCLTVDLAAKAFRRTGQPSLTYLRPWTPLQQQGSYSYCSDRVEHCLLAVWAYCPQPQPLALGRPEVAAPHLARCSFASQVKNLPLDSSRSLLRDHPCQEGPKELYVSWLLRLLDAFHCSLSKNGPLLGSIACKLHSRAVFLNTRIQQPEGCT